MSVVETPRLRTTGFTLIEIVVVLVILGIVGAFSGMMLSSVVKRFGLERDAAAMNQKVEATMTRIVKELTWALPASVEITDAGRTLRWDSRHPARVGDGQQELTWSGVSGDDLFLNGEALLDQVDHFEVPDTLIAGYIQLHLETTITPTPHQTLVYLRDDI